MEKAVVRIERTDDVLAVASVFNHPDVVRDVWDGGTPKNIPHSAHIYHFLVKDELFSDGAVHDEVLGALFFVPMNPVTWNPHMVILPAHRGIGAQALRLGIDWMFENTPCVKVVGYPPSFNKPMVRVFGKCGFKIEGFSPASFLWNGILHDRVMYGTEKKSDAAQLFDAVKRMG